MRKISISDLITKSIDRTKFILFDPISLKKWLYLLFIAYMAGAIGGGSGSGGGNNFSPRERNSEASTKQEFVVVQNSNVDYSQPITETQQVEYLDEESGSLNMQNRSKNFNFANMFSGMSLIGYIFIFIGIIIIIALIVLFTWLSSRFKFIWFNSIHNDVYDIVEPFGRYRVAGNSLFKVMLVISVIGLLSFAIITFITLFSIHSAGAFDKNFDWTFLIGLKIFIAPILILLSVIVFFAILTVCIDHFVVTIMAMDKCLFGEAWGKFARIYKENTKDFWLYILVLIGLGIATGIIATIIAVIVIIALMLIAVIVFGLLFVLFQMIMKAKIIFAIVAFALGVPFALIAFLIITSIGLPFAVFFRNFSLYFISSLDCGYSPLALDNFDDIKTINL
ncbi:MAG: hypothetical protein A2Y03_05555 [Omnitrophica WOR_2 bacterium GWF2_38_59]|nr:MAG: hypothetical protein A2Y06_01200 [Omnitrophica WOR_2 bacterium GWA2_37_7]OGX23045.1 MAG: hypothetical protein A2Y03_05555 [Omnitrophica WOR_2 bacterium GWF2_38_59]OGX51241.1 MAG: hypothetical protein A2243_05340 [Omnitrophica WOR_2 bacterium RIFOXYA2_FULL_38_17]OGX54341.1 MAG: hypothetical protein A2267_00450 [Omnitrophica WOR_2 bacterium RIFOXYA12_FULL_38_10]OGX55362.1 MAG: hypothetical protein A2306_06690 [Omnitrophica WOR_2 bacterium RIFOXYB2_FULL_38_16]OGX57950.1 MAG: hypothetical 